MFAVRSDVSSSHYPLLPCNPVLPSHAQATVVTLRFDDSTRPSSEEPTELPNSSAGIVSGAAAQSPGDGPYLVPVVEASCWLLAVAPGLVCGCAPSVCPSDPREGPRRLGPSHSMPSCSGGAAACGGTGGSGGADPALSARECVTPAVPLLAVSPATDRLRTSSTAPAGGGG